LGYDYEISKKFSSEIMVAMEDNRVSTNTAPAATSGDLLYNQKLSLFIKTASLTWKNIFKGANLTFGQTFTPSAVLTVEPIWNYRCIEKTVSELRNIPAWDMGIRLSGTFYNKKETEVGYNIMIGNGTGSKPENNKYKTFYGDVYAKLLHKKLLLDLYADYNRLDWTPGFRHDRRMIKGLVAYSVPKFTLGVEGFVNFFRNDIEAMKIDSSIENTDLKAIDYSIFLRGKIYKDLLGFFVRYDHCDLSKNMNNAIYIKYTAKTLTLDPNNNVSFFTAGVDFMPNDNIHIMPNIWYTKYKDKGPNKLADGRDLVFRLSIYYVYGK
jgi:hypothetical protein